MQQHVMIDLETLGTEPNAVILEVGLCFFDAKEIHDSHSIIIDAKNSQDLGFEIEIDTLGWWQTKHPENFRRLMNPIEPKHTVEDAAQMVHNLILAHGHNDAIIVWGNGPEFDLVLLKNLFKKAGWTYPFHFRNHRCFRTIKETHKDILPYTPDESTSHTGAGDAINQAKHLIDLDFTLTNKYHIPIL
jgi:hypothetical protein